MVTGFDLVEAQILVARGEELPWKTQPKSPRGWAIEARVCAENADLNFMPTPGPIKHVRTPGGSFVRTDTYVYNGFEITPDYDPMIAKVIAWGHDRDAAIARLDRALAEFVIKGCTTNTAFCRQVLQDDEFKSGTYDTGVIARMQAKESTWLTEEYKEVAMMASAFLLFEEEQRRTARVVAGKGTTADEGSLRNGWQRGLPPRTPNRW